MFIRMYIFNVSTFCLRTHRHFYTERKINYSDLIWENMPFRSVDKYD